MNHISEEIFVNHQARKTKKQKREFINYYTEELSAADIDYQIEVGGWLKHRNLVIGDFENAQLVFTAHYDTAPKRILPIPKIIMFINKIILSNLLDLFFTALFFAVPTLIGIVVGFSFGEILKIYPLLLLIVLTSNYVGPTNEHTANDNTSGVIAINEMVFDLKEDLDDAAFVLFDNEEKGLLGSAHFAKMHQKLLKDKIIINLDCIANGDHILVLPDKKSAKNKQLQEVLKKSFLQAPDEKELLIDRASFFPSDQMNFKNNIGVVAAQHSSVWGYYLTDIHTSKDQKFEKENIDYITHSLKNLVRESKGIQLIADPKELNRIEQTWSNLGAWKWAIVFIVSLVTGYFGGYLVGYVLGLLT